MELSQPGLAAPTKYSIGLSLKHLFTLTLQPHPWLLKDQVFKDIVNNSSCLSYHPYTHMSCTFRGLSKCLKSLRVEVHYDASLCGYYHDGT